MLTKRRRLLPIAGLVIAVVVVALVVLGGRLRGEEPASGNDGDERTGTTTVERRDLVDRQSVEGTYGYGNERSVVNQLGDGGGGNGMANDDVPPSSTDTYFASDEATTPDDEDDCEEDDDPNDDNVGDAPAADDDDQTDDDCDDNDDQDDDKNGNDGDDDRDGRSPEGNPGNSGNPQTPQPQTGTPQQQGTPSGSGGTPNAATDGGDGGDGGDTNPEELTLTSTARPGTIVRRGDTLYKVDDDPVVLMYGDTPAWRDMSPGIARGRDIAQLEQNLKALGYFDGTPDGSYTSATTTAVKNWQEAAGLPQTGTVEQGRIIFMSGPRRAGSRIADLGSTLADGTVVLKTTSTTRLVKVELEVDKQSLVKEGDEVTVTLPGGAEAEGRIRSLGRVAHAAEDSDDGGGGGDPNGGGASTESVLDMTVALNSKKGLSRLDEAPVTVNLASESRKDALSVPVTALLAQPGGGYAVEVVGTNGTATLREVEPGLFAGGYVEIEEGQVKEGERVSVPDE
jgi:hypothetical protein